MKQNKGLTSVFKSTTVRLTGWYLLILMILSIMFSVVIYQVASNDLRSRLERLQTNLQESQDSSSTLTGMNLLSPDNDNGVASSLSAELLYINLFIFFFGGFGSYLFARRSLLPIEKAHEAQSRFTSDASHELRTPLAVMKTELEVALRDDMATVDSLKQILSSNLEEVDRLSKLSEMLLSLSRLDNVSLKLGSVNLIKVARDTIKSFGQPSKRITLNSKGQQIVYGNDVAIADLIKILIDNALQYSPKKSKITITISRQDQSAKFEIINTGHGINSDKLPHIFDRFYRADSSRNNRTHKGYGLGLALAKNIAELHNGTIIADSSPGHDTTLTLFLPLKIKDKAKLNILT